MCRLFSLLLAFTVLAFGSSAVLAQDATPATSTSMLAGLGYPELNIEVAGASYKTPPPAQVPAGRYLIGLTNSGEESWHGFLLRLPEGVTIDAVMAATPGPGEPPPAWLFEASYPGFPGETQPGATNQVVVDLTPGEYLIVGDSFQPFAVTGSAATPGATPEPPATATAHLFEYGFDLPKTLAPGRQIWAVINAGRVPHELLLARSPAPLTQEQALELVMAESQDATPTGGGPSGRDILGVGGIGWLTPGTTGWAEVDLQPGTYVVLCFVPDRETFTPHAAMGMVDVFTVGEAATSTP
ncbi:MAG: hypothetical protein ACJ789_08475 [Thermomicrobiales bacterium]